MRFDYGRRAYVAEETASDRRCRSEEGEGHITGEPTEEFKTQAVKLVTEQGYSVAEAARSLGISENLIRNWKQALQDQGEQAFPGQGRLSPQEQELARLRADNKRLLAERDLLKKAAAFFAREAT
jgi:transposase